MVLLGKDYVLPGDSLSFHCLFNFSAVNDADSVKQWKGCNMIVNKYMIYELTKTYNKYVVMCSDNVAVFNENNNSKGQDKDHNVTG